MKHDFLDKYSHLNSTVHRLDPRVKVICAFIAIIIILSEPKLPAYDHYLIYFLLILAVVLLSKLPLGFIGKRLLIVMPFILLAAFFYPLSVWLTNKSSYYINEKDILAGAFSIFAKAFLAILILIVLTSTEKFHRLLRAMRFLRMPKLIATLSALLYRYIFILEDEILRTNRARDSRTPGKLQNSKLRVYGNQVAVIFLRSWDRSQIVYKSMLSRGFTGEYPDFKPFRISTFDLLFAGLFTLLMLVIRIFI